MYESLCDALFECYQFVLLLDSATPNAFACFGFNFGSGGMMRADRKARMAVEG